MNVANALQAEFSLEEQARIEAVPTDSTAAYTLFLRALNLPAEEAHLLLDEALEVDPNFALAHGRKAYLYSLALTFTAGARVVDDSERENLEAQIREHAERALSLDPDTGIAHLGLANLYLFNWYWTDARFAFERAMESRRGNVEEFGSLVFLNSYLGRHDEAIALARQLIDLNPNDPGLFGTLGIAQVYSKELDAAATNLRFAWESTGIGVFWNWLTNAELARGNPEGARPLLEDFFDGWNPDRVGSGVLDAAVLPGNHYRRLGRTEFAIEVLEMVRARAADGARLGAGLWAMAYLAVGDEERALEWLEVAVENASNHEPEPSFFVLMDLKMNVTNDPVLAQPEFVEVRSRIRGD